jgi:transcriptional regulator with XRE-family HTH domain
VDDLDGKCHWRIDNHAPSLSSKPSQTRIANGLSTCAKLFADGNIAEFARLIQIPRNTVWLWCNGKNLPQLDTPVKICFRLRISVLDLLTQDEFETANDSTRLLPNGLSLPNSRAEIKFINHEQVHSQLLAVLLDHRLPPFSLEETARTLGYHRETLYRNFKDLYRAMLCQV